MPDTPENQAAYLQVYNLRRGLGFPIARIGALTSLAFTRKRLFLLGFYARLKVRSYRLSYSLLPFVQTERSGGVVVRFHDPRSPPSA